MTATLDPDGIPSHALRIWAASGDIYVAIPTVSGGHYITRYPFDSRGLCLALDLIGQHRRDYDYIGSPIDNFLKPSKEPGTHNQRASAEATLRRIGVIK